MMQQQKKRTYEKPESRVLKLTVEQFICTSVVPDAQNSNSPTWDAEQRHDVGIMYVGEDETAPAKHWGDQWDDDGAD